MKGFVKRRPVSPEFAHALRQADPQRGAALAEGLQGALPAIALTGHTALSTAFLNDVDGEMIYAQQLYGYGKKGDVFIGCLLYTSYGHDLHFLRLGREYALTGDIEIKREADYWKSVELTMMHKAAVSYYPSYVAVSYTHLDVYKRQRPM